MAPKKQGKKKYGNKRDVKQRTFRAMAPEKQGKKKYGNKRDVKQRTRNRHPSFDDIFEAGYSDDGYLDNEKFTLREQRFNRTSKAQTVQVARRAPGSREIAYRITVRNAGRGGTDYVLNLIRDLTENFLPLSISLDESKNVVFFVGRSQEAESVKMLNRRLSHTSHPKNKFTIRCSAQPAAWESIDKNIKEAVFNAVKESYNAATNSINLGDFQNNRIFAERGLSSLCSLSRNSILIEAVRAVANLYPNVSGLVLKGNRLTSLQQAKSFTFACPSIVELDLSDNNLDRVKELGRICQWKIERLCLENNPLCGAFSNTRSYLSAVHDHLPHVTFLDGVFFNVNPVKAEAVLRRRVGIFHPPVTGAYYPDPMLRQRVEQLLVQFYELYDGQPTDKARQMLVNAYDENATFSFVTDTSPDLDKFIRGDNRDTLNQYARSSHNVCQENNWESFREKIVHKGAMAIAVALSKLPPTAHDQSSFMLEFITIRQQLLVFTLRGLFRDGPNADNTSQAPKLFNRTFVVVPRENNKMAIVNDDLLIAKLNAESLKRYVQQMQQIMSNDQAGSQANNLAPLDLAALHNQQEEQRQMEQMQMAALMQQLAIEQQALIQQQFLPVQQQVTAPIQQQEVTVPVQVSQSQPVPSTQSGYDRNDPEVQKQMVYAFSQQSGMKPEWAKRCLEDTKWDFEAAGKAFNDLRAQIPDDAFE